MWHTREWEKCKSWYGTCHNLCPNQRYEKVFSRNLIIMCYEFLSSQCEVVHTIFIISTINTLISYNTLLTPKTQPLLKISMPNPIFNSLCLNNKFDSVDPYRIILRSIIHPFGRLTNTPSCMYHPDILWSDDVCINQAVNVFDLDHLRKSYTICIWNLN